MCYPGSIGLRGSQRSQRTEGGGWRPPARVGTFVVAVLRAAGRLQRTAERHTGMPAWRG